MAGPELTTDLTGNPRVEVFFDPDDLDVDAASLDIFRFSEGRTWKVRGGVNVATGVAVLDWECPFQTDIAYRAQQYAADGSVLGFTDTSTTFVDYTGTVIHNPLDPLTWVSVTVLNDSASSLLSPSDGALAKPQGGLSVWNGTGQRRLEGVPVSLLVDSIAEADTFQSLMGTTEIPKLGVLCLRSSLGIRWPRTFFMRGDFAEVDLNVKHGGGYVQFSATVDEVQPPFPGVAAPFLTYADMEAAYSTYADAAAAYATYQEAQRDYSLAGLGS